MTSHKVIKKHIQTFRFTKTCNSKWQTLSRRKRFKISECLCESRQYLTSVQCAHLENAYIRMISGQWNRCAVDTSRPWGKILWSAQTVGDASTSWTDCFCSIKEEQFMVEARQLKPVNTELMSAWGVSCDLQSFSRGLQSLTVTFSLCLVSHESVKLP